MDVQLKADVRTSDREGHGSAASYTMSLSVPQEAISPCTVCSDWLSGLRLHPDLSFTNNGSMSDGLDKKNNIAGCLESQASERKHVFPDDQMVISGFYFSCSFMKLY